MRYSRHLFVIARVLAGATLPRSFVVRRPIWSEIVLEEDEVGDDDDGAYARLCENLLLSEGQACPCIPNGSGNVEQLPNIVRRSWHPLQIAAGVTTSTYETDENGALTLVSKHSGFHALRHFYAS